MPDFEPLYSGPTLPMSKIEPEGPNLEALLEMVKNELVRRSPTTKQRLFGELIDQFENAYMPKLAIPSQNKYRSLLRCHVKPAFALMPLEQITTKVIDEWHRRRQPKVSHGQPGRTFVM
jgi:hypothetical protein